MDETTWRLTTRKPAIRLRAGPHLFVDDHLVGSISGVRKTVHQPRRRREPVIRGPGTMVGPFNTVTYSETEALYRMWYWFRKSIDPGAQAEVQEWTLPSTGLCYAESTDGITWTLPALGLVGGGENKNNVLLPGVYSTLIDGGPTFREPEDRYRMLSYGPEQYRAWYSRDGIHWRQGQPIECFPIQDVEHDAEQIGVNDIISVNWDPLASRYVGIFKQEALPWEGYGPRPTAPWGPRFVVQSSSKDFLNWEPLHRIFTADSRTDQTEFYGMEMIVRGDLYLGFLRVLRDDLPEDAESEPRGIGWIELAVSRDGESWTRIREPFMDRNPEPGSWDHAMTWTGGPPVSVGREMRFYYGGFSAGHKIGTRSIGLATLPRDRYVSYDGSFGTGYVRTRPLKFSPGAMTVNVGISHGSLGVQILGADGNAVPGYSFSDCSDVTSDDLDAPVRWGARVTLPDGTQTPLVFEFGLRNAELYGFQLLQRPESDQGF